MTGESTPFQQSCRRFWSDRGARCGVVGIGLLFLLALFAPFLANGRPLLLVDGAGKCSLPFLREFFAPESPERFVEQCFNYLLLLFPVILLSFFWKTKRRKLKRLLFAAAAIFFLLPFLLTPVKMEKIDYRKLVRENPPKFVLFAPVPYGPFELAGTPYETPTREHLLGLDEVGRDVASRLLYGSRTSLAVGVLATLIALVIGTTVGLLAGFYRGIFDLVTMRLVEILLCFPTFLLLLIVMSLLKDRAFDQSILAVIAVIGLTGWIGLTFLVRGEVLKQQSLPYMQSCIVSGIPVRRILFVHLLPNITGPILISFTFGVAGAILSESGLSFLGFGVQPPAASWGGLLRQAFDNPQEYWHLTAFAGAALFWAVFSFNLLGEGLRKALSPR